MADASSSFLKTVRIAKSLSMMSILKSCLRPLYYGGLNASRRAHRAVLRVLRTVVGQRLFLKYVGIIRQDADTVVEVANFRLEAGNPIPFYRAETLLTKEPDTIFWIDQFFREGDVFYDVGANVGVFSLYAARKGVHVIAFEPFFENYALLNRNIQLNALGDRIAALNLAIHNETVLSQLNVSALDPGKAGHSFRQPIGSDGKEYSPVFAQSVLGFDLDHLVKLFSMPKPNFIKIDVDGNDHLVARGMATLLSDPCLRGIAIELNLEERREDRDIIEWIEGFGFEKLTSAQFLNKGYIDSGIKSYNHFFRRIG